MPSQMNFYMNKIYNKKQKHSQNDNEINIKENEGGSFFTVYSLTTKVLLEATRKYIMFR